MALIVDIPMPKNCHECHLYCDFTRRMDIDRNEHERPQDCLIKGEIPDEHGDLIEKTEISKGLLIENSNGEKFFAIRVEDYNNMPVVVEASK